MTQKKEISSLNLKLGWLITLCAFIIGFWHTHKGLIPFKLLDGNGSYIFAGLILMVLVLAYRRLLDGVKYALIFYIICAFFNFTFNLNSIYPSMLGRKLMTEETTFINNTLQSYSAKVDSIFNNAGSAQGLGNLTKLRNIKRNLINQLVIQKGPGPESRKELADFNRLAGAQIGNINNLNSEVAIQKWVTYNEPQMNEAIKTYIKKNFAGEDLRKMEIYNNKEKLDSLKKLFNPQLEQIIADQSDVNVDTKLKGIPNQQITTLKDLVGELDRICYATNKAANKEIIPALNEDSDAQSKYPKIQNIGNFDYTYESIFSRLGRIDTWGIIFLVAFIDFIVPLAIYYLIRKKDEDDDRIVFKPGKF